MQTKIDFISKSKYALFFSTILSIVSIVLLVIKGLNLGIDFRGGIIIEFSTTSNLSLDDTRRILKEKHYSDSDVQNDMKSNKFILKVASQGIDSIKADSVRDISNILKNIAENIAIHRVDYIGPKVSEEFVYNGIKSIILALIGMMIYVGFRFKWQFGVGVILSLLHDVIMTFGFFSITGYQFDLTSVAVILTIIGYSINDSIVIYDRIRENLTLPLENHTKDSLSHVINRSINETLSRTIMTSLTTLVVCLALVFLGGETFSGFGAGLSFGIAFGTYSSIYISAPVLIFFCRKNT